MIISNYRYKSIIFISTLLLVCSWSVSVSSSDIDAASSSIPRCIVDQRINNDKYSMDCTTYNQYDVMICPSITACLSSGQAQQFGTYNILVKDGVYDCVQPTSISLSNDLFVNIKPFNVSSGVSFKCYDNYFLNIVTDSQIRVNISSIEIDCASYDENTQRRSCIYMNGENNRISELNLHNVTIRNAHSNSQFIESGAVTLYRLSATVTDSLFINCTSNGPGGAIGILDSTPSLNVFNSRFYNNVGSYGGALYTIGSSINVYNSIFSNNTANQHGGAIYSDFGNVQINSNVFLYNTAITGSGGAVRVCSERNVRLYSNNFDSNKAINGYGGALYLGQNTQGLIIFDVSYSLFTDNIALYGGGIATQVQDRESGAFNLTLAIFKNNRGISTSASIYFNSQSSIRLIGGKFFLPTFVYQHFPPYYTNYLKYNIQNLNNRDDCPINSQLFFGSQTTPNTCLQIDNMVDPTPTPTQTPIPSFTTEGTTEYSSGTSDFSSGTTGSDGSGWATTSSISTSGSWTSGWSTFSSTTGSFTTGWPSFSSSSTSSWYTTTSSYSGSSSNEQSDSNDQNTNPLLALAFLFATCFASLFFFIVAIIKGVRK
ncbi:hypothetical protein PPL_00037 [Heterostelium album PN500]|uniref:Polymorphic outer membrane protein n=1 Tax=Heterostelium pallidum (strain ATCC 26659 / Pp 5 / PN500) TaxID=670386 RepID=D3BVN6_HETP5|nr:hypothetical protein PPL_00037 [Heterostelium album PN500]EFA74539.1 hypothetical protein PPL_00037 [Heterostelium album PN500]|eukprot:XP_020426673.1 hypothetical protein PPL_00037 [Heterostelium album PN500]